MRIIEFTIVGLGLVLCGCVSGAPDLTPAQEAQLEQVHVYKSGEAPHRDFQVVGAVTAADCSGAPAGGRVWGNAEKAIDTLKRKAVVMGADAVVNVSCGAAPMLNNCWAAQKCSGDAVKIQTAAKN